MKKSLLIDINYKNTRFETRSEVAIESIEKILTEKFLYTDHYYLTEEGKGEKPTKGNIIKYINRLIEESPNCNEIWIHYMGHSTKIIDSKNDDVPRGLMPIDYKTQGYISHEELKELFDKIKCNLYLILDCCYGNHGYGIEYSLKMINGKFIREMNDIVHIRPKAISDLPKQPQIEEKKEEGAEVEKVEKVEITEEKKEKFYGRRIISLYMGACDDKKKRNESKKDIANLFSRRFVEILEDYGYNLDLDLFLTTMCMKLVEEKFFLQTLLFSSNVSTRGKAMIFVNFGTPKKLQIEYRIPDEVKRELIQLRAQKEQKKTDDLKQIKMFKTNVVDPATIKIGNKEENNFSQYKNPGNDLLKKEIKQSSKTDLVFEKKQKKKVLNVEPPKVPVVRVDEPDDFLRNQPVSSKQLADEFDDFSRKIPNESSNIEPHRVNPVTVNIEPSKSQQIIQKEIVNIEKFGHEEIRENIPIKPKIAESNASTQTMKKQSNNPIKIPIIDEIIDTKNKQNFQPIKIPIINEIIDTKNKQNFQPIKTRENKRMLLDPAVIMRQPKEEKSELSTQSQSIDIPIRKQIPIEPPRRPREFNYLPSIQDDNASVTFADNVSVTSFQSKKMSRIMSLKDIKNARKVQSMGDQIFEN